MLEALKKFYHKESPRERSERMAPAAGYGALIAMVYSLTFTLINVYTFPNLPLGVDWARLLLLCAGSAAGLALCGAIAGWFTEEYEGIVGGGLLINFLVIIFVLSSSGTKNSLVTAQTIVTVLPLIGVCMLAAWGLRWAARRHLEIMREEQPGARAKRLAWHVSLIVLIGLVPGLLGRMDQPAELTLRQLDKLLRAAANDPAARVYLPLKQVPALQQHFGVDYVLYPRSSALTIGTLDVTIKFADGYTLTCSLPVTSQTTYITQCTDG